MENQKYNGWSNYSTWRIALEFFDGITESLDAEACQDIVEEHIQEHSKYSAQDYAMAFIADVNWREIAEHLND